MKHLNLTNRKWFSVVCTLIDNNIHHHSDQNVVDSRGGAESIRIQTTLNHFRFVFLTTIFNAQAIFFSERDQNRDTKKEQALSITFSQYDWFISQNGLSRLAITLRDKLTRA